MEKTIIIADDEKLVLFGISALISENNSEYKVVATCTDGNEALQACIEKSPSLLLTDIGMPGMNGLELIEKVKKIDPNIKIAVLSCHDEYELVHKAFILGACDYILKKDIDKENIQKLFTKIFSESEKYAVKQKKNSIKSLTDIYDFIPEIPGKLGIIRFKTEEQDKNTDSGWYPDIPILCQIITNNVSAQIEIYTNKQNNDLVIFLPQKEKTLSDDAGALQIFQNIRIAISKYVNRRVFIAYYPIQENETILYAYTESLRIIDSLFYEHNSAVLTEKTLVSDEEKTLTFAIDFNSSATSWIKTLDLFMKEAKKKRLASEAVKTEIIFAVKHLLYNIRKTGRYDINEKLINANQPYYRKIMSFEDWNALKLWLENILKQIAQKLSTGTKEHKVIFNIKAYIHNNLEKDLRLGSVAALFGINPNYLSAIFKKDVGKNYIDYVNEKRISYATELLKTTNLSAKEISYKCGYTNPNYFSRIFRKITKSTVTDYQRK